MSFDLNLNVHSLAGFVSKNVPHVETAEQKFCVAHMAVSQFLNRFVRLDVGQWMFRNVGVQFG